jgi:hypothetical protein
MNFDKYSGALKNYTEAEAKADFGAGFVFGKGFERASVGEGALRVEHPNGVNRPSLPAAQIGFPSSLQKGSVVLGSVQAF